MLSDAEQREIEKALARYAERGAACIDALRIVQRHRRWISDESLADVARFLGLTADEVESVASFYNLIFRKPVGRHVVLICDSVSCWISGSDKLIDYLANRWGMRMGETTRDGRFTLLPVACLGACDHAPTLMVDEDTYRDLSVEKLDATLEKYE